MNSDCKGKLGSCQQKLTFLADMLAKAEGKSLSAKKKCNFFCGGRKILTFLDSKTNI